MRRLGLLWAWWTLGLLSVCVVAGMLLPAEEKTSGTEAQGEKASGVYRTTHPPPHRADKTNPSASTVRPSGTPSPSGVRTNSLCFVMAPESRS